MTRAATNAATIIKPMIVACTMTFRAICNEEAEAPAGKVAEAPLRPTDMIERQAAGT
jgi:hypothetical protein